MSVSSVRMDSPWLMDTVYHAPTVVLHANQPTEPLPTNVLAATLASDSMAVDNAKLAIHHALPATTPGRQIHAHRVMKTPQWELQAIVYVTSPRFDLFLAGPVRTTVQVVPFSNQTQGHAKMIQLGAKELIYTNVSVSIWITTYQSSTVSTLIPTKLSTHSMLRAVIHLWL